MEKCRRGTYFARPCDRLLTHRNEIETSPDLEEWERWQQIDHLSGEQVFDDPLLPNEPLRFYRINRVE